MGKTAARTMLPLSPTKSALIKVPSASILPETLIKAETDTPFYWTGWKKGINDRARERAIVVHGAAYANPSVCKSGRLGRSFGCPALPQALTKPIINTIKGGSVLFIYANNYMAKSSILPNQTSQELFTEACESEQTVSAHL